MGYRGSICAVVLATTLLAAAVTAQDSAISGERIRAHIDLVAYFLVPEGID